MKMLITEKQLSKILRKKKQMNKDIDEVENTTSTTSSTPTSTTSSATASSSTTSSTSGEAGTSPSAGDYPPYPEVGHWESGITRGPANQIGVTKWSDTVGSKITRGHANPLK
jgi:hypothetical protein